MGNYIVLLRRIGSPVDEGIKLQRYFSNKVCYEKT